VVRAIWLIPALFAAVLLLAATDRASGLPKWYALRQELRESSARIDLLRSEVGSLKTQVEALEHDPSATERAIREVLELARPGEIVVRFKGADEGPTSRLN